MADQDPPCLARATNRAPASWPTATRGPAASPGVAFAITGPGLTNAATALGQAYGDSIPLLLVSSVNRRHELGLGKGYLHEMPNQREPVGRAHSVLAHAAAAAANCRRCSPPPIAVFRSARPRPVHIEIPIDVGEEKSEWADDRFVPFTSLPPAPAPAALDEAARLIASAKRLLIIAGGGAAGAAAEVTSLAELTGAPVHDHHQRPRHRAGRASGSTAISASPTGTARTSAREADLVLAIGTELGETDYDFWSPFPFAPSRAADPHRPRSAADRALARAPRLALVGDSALAARGLNDRLANAKLRRRSGLGRQPASASRAN